MSDPVTHHRALLMLERLGWAVHPGERVGDRPRTLVVRGSTPDELTQARRLVAAIDPGAHLATPALAPVTAPAVALVA